MFTFTHFSCCTSIRVKRSSPWPFAWGDGEQGCCACRLWSSLPVALHSSWPPLAGSQMRHLIAQLPGRGNAMRAETLPSLSLIPGLPLRLILLFLFVDLHWWQHAWPPLGPRLIPNSQETPSDLIHLLVWTQATPTRFSPKTSVKCKHCENLSLVPPRSGNGHNPSDSDCSRFSWGILWSRKS